LSASPVRRILIAPLDWGLGHTTRCVPVIRRLVNAKREVVFAGNDVQKTFITATFPGIRCLDLPGYGVKYSAGRFLPNILRQIPKILSRIRHEHRWLLKIADQEGIDAVISDNRYGLWHPRIPSVILTHQASPITALGPKADALFRRLHYRMLERFSETWLVDVPGTPNLSGKLAHPPKLPHNSRYIGLLSQLELSEPLTDQNYVLILLSGPEPQRTILADALWQQACALPDRQFIFVEGRADAVRRSIPSNIRHFPRATTAQLQHILAGASIVVCRSGYSSLMDLALFGKRAILIPTPGQTEQEYLAWKLEVDGIFMQYQPRRFDLSTALEVTADFRFGSAAAPADFRLFETVLDEWIHNRS
jgi:predicted glycosyltransferase